MLRKYLHKVVCALLKAIYGFFMHLEVYGAENLKNAPPTVLLTSTHASLHDVLIIGASCPLDSPVHPFSYIAASWVGQMPIAGWILHHAGGAIYVQRKKDARKQGEKKSMRRELNIFIDILNSDKGSLVIFPEAGRTEGQEVGQVKRGAIYLSSETNKEIYPMAIYGQAKMSFADFFLRRRHVVVVIGQPIKPTFNLENQKDYRQGGDQLRIEMAKLFEQAKNISQQKTTRT